MKKHLALAILLTALAGCDAYLVALWALGRTESQIAKLQQFASEEELKSYLIEQAVTPIFRGGGGGFGGTFSGALDAEASDGDFVGTPPTAGPGEQDDSNGVGDQNYSTTTEQEQGVHEADVVKNDGQYVYVLTHGSMRIVQATPPEGMVETSSVELDGSGWDMYLAGDRVVTITTPDTPVFLGDDTFGEGLMAPEIYYYSPQTEITVIDVADRTSPHVLSRTRLDGWISASRMIGSRLYLVAINDPIYYVDTLPVLEEEPSFEDIPLDDILPNVAISVGGEEVYRGNVAEFSDHYRPVDADGLGLTTIVSLDIDAPQNYQAQTVVAYPANVYASTEALYLTDNNYSPSGNLRGTTDIYKFAFTAEGTAPVAAGSVPGRVLNQYSMSEHNGFLRLATTVGPTFGALDIASESSNNVFVVKQEGDQLQQIGAVEGLAPGETIYSARFLGDRGYLVTFEQIDPLFTIDLSDPFNPRAVGELKVPGFSTFIMPLGEDHLLTIGRHTDPDSGLLWPEAIRLSIFDVTDFANPQLDFFEIVGTNGAYSEALYNPKALTYFAEGDLLAFPVEIYGWGDGFPGPFIDFAEPDGESEMDMDAGAADDDGDAGTSGAVDDDPIDVVIDIPPPPADFFTGLYVYQVTTTNGFEQLGRISTATEQQDYYYWGGPDFTRGVFIDETVYAVSSESVQSAAVEDIAVIISTVEFPEPDYDVYPMGGEDTVRSDSETDDE